MLMHYSDIQHQSRETLRRAILDAATRLLVGGGFQALSMRRVAAKVGCSTTVLYTMFGGKPGLLDALWGEGFDRLWQAEEEVGETESPLSHLAALGSAYRQHALENPDYYRVMFGGAIAGFQPSPSALDQSRRVFQVLVDGVQAAIDAGVFRPADPETVALVLWATVHGVVSLEIAGGLRESEGQQVFEQAMGAVATGFMEGS